jgi:hypothetical protein
MPPMACWKGYEKKHSGAQWVGAQWVILSVEQNIYRGRLGHFEKNYEASNEILVAAGNKGLVVICRQHPPL